MPLLLRALAQLDSESFQERERATKELRKMGWAVEPALHKALEGEPSVEVRRRVKDLLDGIREQTLRMLRGMEVLERIGTSAARKVLASLAEGMVDVRSQGCPATPALLEAEQDQAMAGSRAARSAQ